MLSLKPNFAVCLAAYNGAQYIEAQINSILSQVDVDLTVIVSIDPSSDETEAIVMDLAKNNRKIILLPLGETFGGAGPNFYRLIRDINFSKFDYLSFSDQDDVWYSDKLSRAHKMMQKHNALGYSSGFEAFWPSGKKLAVNKAYPQRSYDYLFESAGPGCTYVIGKGLAESIKVLIEEADTSLYGIDFHDWLIYAYARHKGFKWVIDPLPSLKYRQHDSNQLGVNAGWRAFWLRVNKVLSGYGFAQSRLIARLIGASSIPTVQKGLLNGWIGYLWLSLRCRQCRRRGFDQVMFFISCLVLTIIYPFKLISNK
jgi:rhamnosyltransferase